MCLLLGADLLLIAVWHALLYAKANALLYRSILEQFVAKTTQEKEQADHGMA